MSLSDLEMLTEVAIRNLNEVPSSSNNGMVEYQLEKGSAMAFKLLKKPEIAVADSFLSEGTVFPFHRHEGSVEIMSLYKGCVTVLSESLGRKKLSPGDNIILPPSDAHALIVKQDSWIVAVTMPADENFPE
jgi:quercetin dioxygenase-like cupin family protein